MLIKYGKFQMEDKIYKLIINNNCYINKQYLLMKIICLKCKIKHCLKSPVGSVKKDFPKIKK